MKTKILLAVLLGTAIMSVTAARAQLIYSNTGTNYTATVYSGGYTSQVGYLVITNLSATTLKIEVHNYGSSAVYAVQATTSTGLPTVTTNAPVGLLIGVGQSKVLTSWPLVDNKMWSMITTGATGHGQVWVNVSTP